jgi:pSer/pThr/pTyr-binding forkhead associated (FHA) protein
MTISRKRCVLLIISGPDRGKEILVTGNRFRVGKNPDNDLVVADETVSRYHFDVVYEDGGYLVRDVGSTNGTIVDGARIREAYLRSGATVTAGRVRIQVRLPVERLQSEPGMGPATIPFDATLTFRQAKDKWTNDFERRYVAWLLKETGGNISSAARLAEMDRKYLHKLKKKHKL